MAVSAEVVSLLAAAVAVFSAVLAVRAAALVARAVISAQEVKPGDLFTVRVTGGQARRDLSTDSRHYDFTFAVSNRSPAARTFEAPVLRVTYRTRANFLGAVDVAANEPLVVPPGQTDNVALRFTSSNVIPRHSRVDAYTLLLETPDGERVIVDASLANVLRADSDGPGSATWGLD